jgi:hypothetical protein
MRKARETMSVARTLIAEKLRLSGRAEIVRGK